jgi:pilus assembly protein CpaC
MSVVFLLGILTPIYSTAVSAADEMDSSVDSTFVDEIHLLVGEIVSVKVDSLSRLAITDPLIVDVDDATGDEIILVGKSLGQAALFIWDSHGKRSIVCHVLEQEMEVVKKRLQKLLKTIQAHEVRVEVNEKEGKVVVSGELPAQKREQVDKILFDFGDKIVNLTHKEAIADLVQIDIQVTELNTTLTKSLGVKWTTPTTSSSESESSSSGSTTESDLLEPNYDETLPSFDGSIGDLFKIGDFRRTNAIQFVVNALLEEGKAKILSKPQLVVISGEEAKFLVGGEIPIRTTTSSSSGGLQENVSFKEYGISMTITPTIKQIEPVSDAEKIDLVVNLEISDIDASNAVGDDVAFTTRSASTHLFLDDRQTIVLAGLIRHQKSERISKVPFLGSVPLLGALFRNRETVTPDSDQELVISITPSILKKNRNSSNDAQASLTNEAVKMAPKQLVNPSIPTTIPKEMAEYVQGVQRIISQSIIYPEEAKEYGWEGTVKLGLLILRDGTLAYALVKESSGYDVFDEYALNTAKKIAPYTVFPEETELQELNVTIPIVYSLKRN